MIERVEVEVVEVPLRHQFVTARDKLARMVSRPVVITLRIHGGRTFYGEAVPIAYVTGETQESVVEAVKAARPDLLGADVTRLRSLTEAISRRLPEAPTARAGIEMALYSAFAGLAGTSLWKLFGGAKESVETDVTLSIVADVVERAMEAAERGFRCFKMKIGGEDRAADFSRLVAIHKAVPGACFRLDANQAFEPQEALDFIRRALDVGVSLELVEQPVLKVNLEGLDRVAARSPVPVFADEAVKTPSDALRLVRETRTHGINVKLMKSGITGALDIIAIARAAGRKLMIGCMLETRRGIATSLALACGTGAFDYVDLDSHLLLNEPGENPYFTTAGPKLSISRG